MPVQRDWLIILLSGQETLPVISFNSFDDILSYPELDLGFNWPIILTISVGLVYWNKKELEQGVLRYESKGALFAVLIDTPYIAMIIFAEHTLLCFALVRWWSSLPLSARIT